MKTVRIKDAFDGYPQGAKPGSRRVSYAVGQEPELSNEFADLIIGKDLAEEIKPKPPSPPAPAVPAPEKDESP